MSLVGYECECVDRCSCFDHVKSSPNLPPRESRGDVTNPDHYRTHPSGVECIDITEHLGFNIGNAIKYLWRAGLKEGSPTMQDMAKARWYLVRAIALGRGVYDYPITIVDRVLSCEPSALTRVLGALVGVGHHHAIAPRDMGRALVVLDEEIAKMEGKAA